MGGGVLRFQWSVSTHNLHTTTNTTGGHALTESKWTFPVMEYQGQLFLVLSYRMYTFVDNSNRKAFSDIHFNVNLL